MDRIRSLTVALLGACCLLGETSHGAEPVKPRLDRNGDELPDGALARYGTMRLHHATLVVNVAFSRDGKQLVSISDEDKAVRVWEVPSGKLLFRVPVQKDEAPLAAAFGPDGTLFVVGEAPAFSAWDLKKGRRLFAKERDDAGCAVIGSPDGKTLAVGLESGATVLLDSATGEEKAVLEAPADAGMIVQLTFTPDGSRLAVGYDDGMVRLWDVGQKKRLHTLPSEKGAEGVFRGACFAPDGRMLVVLTDDHVLQFDVVSGKAVADFTSPLANLACIQWTPDGKQLVGIGTDGRVFRWEAGTGKAIAETEKALLADDEGIGTFNPSTSLAAVVRETAIHLIDARTGKLLHEQAEPRTPLLQVRLLGKNEVVCRGEDGSLRYWDTATGAGTKIVTLLAADEPRPIVSDLSADGKRVAAADEAGTVRVLEGKKELWKAKAAEEGIPSQLRFSPDGATLAACQQGGVILFDAATGKRRQGLVSGDGETRVVWSRDGRMLAVANAGKEEVAVWEVATGRKRQTLETKEATVLAFAVDGRRLAVGSVSGTIHVFRLGAEGAPLELAVGEKELHALAFSRDDSRLAAAAGDTVRLWDAEGKPLVTFRGHEGPVHDLVFAPDGRTLVTVSQDGTALVWDAVNPLHPLRARDSETTPDSLWHDLSDEDAARAFRAILALRAKPAESVAFLKGKLTAVKAMESKRVERLLADLENDDFTTRDKAARELEALDVQVEAALRAALKKAAGAETQRILRMLIEKVEAPAIQPDQMRELRAIEVLERIGSNEARALLETLAGGADARLTREAKAAVRRLIEMSRE